LDIYTVTRWLDRRRVESKDVLAAGRREAAEKSGFTSLPYSVITVDGPWPHSPAHVYEITRS